MGSLVERYKEALTTLAKTHLIAAEELHKILSILDALQLLADLPVGDIEKSPQEKFSDWLDAYDAEEHVGLESDLSSLPNAEEYRRFISGEEIETSD